VGAALGTLATFAVVNGLILLRARTHRRRWAATYVAPAGVEPGPA
jgi:hypothetical protein